MLPDLFHTVLKMNGIACMTALFVLAVKCILQKAGLPRRILFLMWAVIAFRLICPVSLPANFSMLNLFHVADSTKPVAVAETVPYVTDEYVSGTGAEAVEQTAVSETSLWDKVFSVIWIAGTWGMLVYGVVSYILLKRRLRFSVKYKDNIFLASTVPGSFVFGIFRPKIYIPDSVTDDEMAYIAVHEQMHIKRADHITKIIAYLLLSIHWFNPVNWFLYKLFADDMEFACDESVVSQIGQRNRKAYLYTLLRAASKEKCKMFLYSVSFAQSTKRKVKRRVCNILQCKQRPKALTAAAAVCCLMVALVCGTNAIADSDKLPKENAFLSAVPQMTNSGAPTARESAQNAALPPGEGNAEAAVTQADTANVHSNAAAAPQASTAFDAETAPVVPFGDAAGNQQTAEPAAKAVNQVQDADNIAASAAPVPETAEIDFAPVPIEEGAGSESVQQRLDQSGIIQADSGHAAINESYIMEQYDAEAPPCDVTCAEDGSISVYFDLNTDTLVDVTFTDRETEEVVGSFGVLAGSQNAYSFSGFEEGNTYDVKIEGKTGEDWNIDGTYIVY